MKKSKLCKYFIKTIEMIILFIFIVGMIPKVNAVTQYKSTNIDEIDDSMYPGVKKLIQNMKKIYPNWNFKILYTGLDWNEVLENEHTGHGAIPTNLIPTNSSTYNNKWICPICSTTPYDTGDWYCASKEAIAYMIDIRNWIDENNIFQFLELTYSDYDYAQIKAMVSGTFLDKDSYINTIIQSGKSNNVNVYYIVARILQEQGTNGTILSKGQGFNGQYYGYYNVFNIGATGNTNDEVMINGLKRAQKQGWTSIEKAIDGGVRIIMQTYISQGQNTLYFQKFDVENSDGILYKHQYMQNLLASKNEASKLTKVIKDMGYINNNYTFIIPLYENMPKFTNTNPNVQYEISGDIVRINVEDSLRVRNAPNGSQIIDVLSANERVLRVEKALTQVNGTYWDKIQTNNGMYGYVARETYNSATGYKLYLVPVEEIVNNEENTNGESPTENQITLGDVNGDGKISATDYVLIKRHIMQTKLIEDESQKLAADVNEDGRISATDYVLIKKIIMNRTV